jgi:hypothetical protein
MRTINTKEDLMLKSVWCVSCLVAFSFLMATPVSGKRKIVCEKAAIGPCWQKVGKEPVAKDNCPTKKGWVIQLIPDCPSGKKIPNEKKKVPAAGVSGDEDRE